MRMRYGYRYEMRKEICHAIGIDTNALKSKCRTRQHNAARATIATAGVILYGMTQQDAAELAGYKSHSSTNTAINRVLDGEYDHYPISKQYREQCMEVQA